MEFGKKLLIGFLCLAVGGEYALYKKFENHPNTFLEMARWPYNKEHAEASKKWKEYNDLKKLPLETITGYIDKIKKIEKRYGTYETGIPVISSSHFSLIELTDGKRLLYTGGLLAIEGDKINLNFMPTNDIKRINEFITGLGNLSPEFLHLTKWDILDLYHPNKRNILVAVEKFKQEELKSLDGIVESYEIIK